MKTNTAYGSPSLADTHSRGDWTTTSDGLSDEDRSPTAANNAGRFEGHRYIVDGREYEIPDDWDSKYN